jgi:hypothetical protein
VRFGDLHSAASVTANAVMIGPGIGIAFAYDPSQLNASFEQFRNQLRYWAKPGFDVAGSATAAV